jgi:hypothetical protein
MSLEVLHTTDDLVGPIEVPFDTTDELFAGVPDEFRCHASLKRLAWGQTLRCGLARRSCCRHTLATTLPC